MLKLEVFDPPMCCSTGVCGPEVDPKLARFAGDLEWLKRQGVEVGRYNLSQNPGDFVSRSVVKNALTAEGNKCLPLILADGNIVSRAEYPSRETLAGFANVTFHPSLFTPSVRELVAIGASIASNCEPCFKYHYAEARKLGVSKDDIRLSVDMAQAVKDSPARAMLALAERVLDDSEAQSPQADSTSKEAGTDKGGKCCG